MRGGGGGSGGAAVPLAPGGQGLLRLGRQLPGELSDELAVEVGIAVLTEDVLSNLHRTDV